MRYREGVVGPDRARAMAFFFFFFFLFFRGGQRVIYESPADWSYGLSEAPALSTACTQKKQPPRRFPPPFLERPAGTQLEVAEERAAGRPLGSAVSTMQLRSQQCSATDSESISRKFIGVRRSRILLGFSLIHSHRFIGILPRLWSRFFLCCSLFSRGFFFLLLFFLFCQ